MANEAAGQTLQPTALVHEAWLRLVGDENQKWDGRAHFFAAAAEAMRRILIERARRKSAPRGSREVCSPHRKQKDAKQNQIETILGRYQGSHPPLFNHGDVGNCDELELAATLIEHQRSPVLRDQTMFRLFDANHVAVVKPQRVGLERPPVINVEQGFTCHASIVRHQCRCVKLQGRLVASLEGRSR